MRTCGRWHCALLGAVLGLTGSAVAPQPASARARPDRRDERAGRPRAAVDAGARLVATAVLRNAGHRRARRSTTAVLLSRDARRSREDLRVASVRLGALRAGRPNATQRARVSVPALAAGHRYRLIVCADVRNVVRESNERNNCAAARGWLTVGLHAPAPAPAPPIGPQPPPFPTPGPDTGEEDSPGTMTLQGPSPTSFNAAGGPVRFTVSGAQMDATPEAVQVTVPDGTPLPAGALTLAPDGIDIAPDALSDGRNALEVRAADAEGRELEAAATFWLGSRTLDVTVLDESDQPIAGAFVTARLADDLDVGVTGMTGFDGTLAIHDLPQRTVLLEASAAGNRAGSTAVAVGDDPSAVTIHAAGFKPTSPVDNNDFSLGLDGWDVGSAPVTLVPHTEDAPSPAPAAPRDRAGARREEPIPGALPTSPGASAAPGDDLDLQLSTFDEGPQSASRTFATPEGVSTVVVRYRFITSEVPGGWFGSKYNDDFRVGLRSVRAGGSAAEMNSMNGLGLAAFDAGGATNWRERSLAVDPRGDTVQVDATVANVADGLFDSAVQIDLVRTQRLRIDQLDLRDMDLRASGGSSAVESVPLDYLSVSPHPWFGGNTQIWGTITIRGDESDRLSKLELEVLQDGGVRARARLAPGLESQLYVPFGEDQTIAVSTRRLLFELPSSAMGGISASGDGTVALRARATSQAGETASRDFAGHPAKLVKHAAPLHYNCCNEAEGGDMWVLPSVRPVVEGMPAIEYGDASNMNGGPMPPHKGHRRGTGIDGFVLGYAYLSNGVKHVNGATAAQKLLGLLATAAAHGHLGRIQDVFVTYCRPGGGSAWASICAATPSQAFWNAIRGVTLADGRAAGSVILPLAGHANHFHIDFRGSG